MEKKEKAVCVIFLVVMAAAIVIPVRGLFIDGVYSWHIRQQEFLWMMAECLMMALLFVGIWLIVKKVLLKWLLTAGICLLFIWCHVMFLPMVVSGIYVMYLYLTGYCIRSRCLKQELKNPVFADVLTGCCSVITLFCLMSAVGMGSIPLFRVAVAVTGTGAVVWCMPVWKEWWKTKRGSICLPEWTRGQRLLLLLVLLMLLIQIGRMNISVDFDSLWYGVRSEYMLDNGHGIYENPGTVGLVYTYSKGLEVLLLPLSDLSSHSYLISFQIWMLILALAAVYLIARHYMNSAYSLFAVAAVSTIPGIMNMAITAKTDVMTLTVQMVMVLYLLTCLKGRQVKHLLISAGALFFSWTLKPTAVVFSTAVFGMAFLYLLVTRQLSLKAPWRQWALLLPPLAALTGIWARTIQIVGIPVTSVFSSIFLKMGFQMKYPFAELPLYGDSMGEQSVIAYLIRIIVKMLLLPTGEEMEHVVFAWGSSLLFFLPVVTLAGMLVKRKTVSSGRMEAAAHTVMLPFILVCLISLAMLGQIDGNYFMLLYVFLVLYGFGSISRISGSGLRRWVGGMIVPILLLNLTMTAVSNWSWSLGFTPVQVWNRGSYPHEQKQQEAMEASGNQMIWNLLSDDPRTRVIAAGDHPGVFAFPCNVQSYDDITSSWGNVALVKTMDAFIRYLDYARTDYIYMQAGEVEKESRCHELMGYLIEAGILTDLIYEEGNMLAVVDLHGKYGPEASEAYSRYFESYQTK